MNHELKAPRTRWVFEAYDGKTGELKWSEAVNNLVTDGGINHLLQSYFRGIQYTASWFVGLLSATPAVANTDTATTHPGWTEVQDFSEAQRPALSLGPIGNKAADNSSSKALFTMSANVTVGGAFLSTSAIKGLGGGTLYSAAPFSTGDKPLLAGDILAVTVQVTGA